MCILFVYRKISSQGKYKLILASNRDEFYPRPAKVAHIWQEYSTMLGGRDMEPGREGGTWLAMNKESGKIGVLLNISTPKMAKDKKGRGKIVSDYAISPISISDYCDNLNLEPSAYNPFNFVAVDTLDLPISGVTCYCSDESSSLKLDSDEFLGFGNSPYAKPYQKVAQGLVQFQTTVQKHNDDDADVALTNELLQILKAETRYWPDNQLQQQTSSFSEEFQRGLSSVFVSIPQARYGTRTHTIITVDNENNCKFQEWTMKEPIPDSGNAEWVHTCFRFRIGA